MAPKAIGLACYLLIIGAIALLLVTLIGSQGINFFYFNQENELSLELQVLLSTITSVVLAGSGVSILNGYQQGRSVLHYWAAAYFFINVWQLVDRFYLIPISAILLLIVFVLYAKPSQKFFNEARTERKKRPVGKRVDTHYNIFDEQESRPQKKGDLHRP